MPLIETTSFISKWQWALCGHRAAKINNKNMDKFPRYFLGANSDHDCGMDSLQMHIAVSALIRKAITLPISPPHPSIPHQYILPKDTCFSGFPDVHHMHTFQTPLAKAWTLYLLHFSPFQISTVSSHLLLWSLLNHKNEMDEDKDILSAQQTEGMVLG